MKVTHKFMLKASSAAVIAAISGGAFAAADLDAGTGAALIAAEQNVSGTTTITGPGAVVTFGANMPAGTQAYVRVDLTNGGKFAAAPSAAFNGSTNATGNGFQAATVTVAQGGTAGSNYAIFSVAPAVATDYLGNGVNTFNVAANVNVTSASTVGMEYRLYETLTAAVNQTANTALKDKTANYVTFGTTFGHGGTALTAVADVAAANPYTKVVTQTATSSNNLVSLGTINAAVNGTYTTQGGVAETFTTEINNAAGATTITVTGDFTAAQTSTGLYNGAALNNVFLSTSSDCSVVVNAAATLTATTATFNTVDANQFTNANGISVCYQTNGRTAIPPSSYSAAINVTAASGYTVANFTQTLGSISRNGTTMIVPMAQIPTGYLSRLILVNNGTADRAYSIAAVSETGATVTLTGAGASGTLTAGKTAVIDLPNVMTVSGITNPRTALVVTVNGPQAQISGSYQIVKTDGTSMATHLLDYK